MHTSIHGIERVQGRTKMLYKDVLFIIEKGAVVELGEDQGQEFLLFYSPEDRCCKVALTANKRSVLVSIWETGFRFPPSVNRPDKVMRQEAYRLLKGLILTGVVPFALPDELIVRVEITGQGVYEAVEVGHIPFAASKQQEQAIALWIPLLRPLAHSFEFTPNRTRTQYWVSLIDPSTGAVVKPALRIGHKKLRKRLRAMG